uniref:Uncharacterized protein n=1 Tax=Parascaris univalens TaxID=6257 RepID=A0A915CG65_PARUN
MVVLCKNSNDSFISCHHNDKHNYRISTWRYTMQPAEQIGTEKLQLKASKLLDVYRVTNPIEILSYESHLFLRQLHQELPEIVCISEIPNWRNLHTATLHSTLF